VIDLWLNQNAKRFGRPTTLLKQDSLLAKSAEGGSPELFALQKVLGGCKA